MSKQRGNHLGGWCYEAAVNQIQKLIDRPAKSPKRKAVQRGTK